MTIELHDADKKLLKALQALEDLGELDQGTARFQLLHYCFYIRYPDEQGGADHLCVVYERCSNVFILGLVRQRNISNLPAYTWLTSELLAPQKKKIDPWTKALTVCHGFHCRGLAIMAADLTKAKEKGEIFKEYELLLDSLGINADYECEDSHWMPYDSLGLFNLNALSPAYSAEIRTRLLRSCRRFSQSQNLFNS